jgi:hypothetical protein
MDWACDARLMVSILAATPQFESESKLLAVNVF